MKISKKTKKHLIKTVMERFDFDQAREIVNYPRINSWVSLRNRMNIEREVNLGYAVPSKKEIKKIAKKLLKRTLKEKGMINSGGFTATYSKRKNIIRFNLFFGEDCFVFWDKSKEREVR